MNEFSIYEGTFELCLKKLSKVLLRCEEVNLMLNREQCHFMLLDGVILGHVISHRGIEVDKAKIQVIDCLPLPLR